MKLVKKLLRLLPLFIFLMHCLVFIFNKNFIIYNSSLDTTDISITNNLDILFWKTFGNQQYFFMYPWNSLFNNLYLKICEIFFGYDGRTNMLISFVFNTLFYELVLSILFIMFDVFNFILGIANKWIKKGGNLDD